MGKPEVFLACGNIFVEMLREKNKFYFFLSCLFFFSGIFLPFSETGIPQKLLFVFASQKVFFFASLFFLLSYFRFILPLISMLRQVILGLKPKAQSHNNKD